MTTATYIEVAAKMETAKAARRWVSLSGMLDFLGVSRSGCLSCLHGSRHFFDDYYDLSSQIVKDKIVVFPENGILRIDSKLLRPPVDFDTGLINIAIQKQAYLCIYHTVSQGREHLLHGYHAT